MDISQREPRYINSFQFEGKKYEHQLFPQEQDQVELIGDDGETILEFTANCEVKDKSGRIGNIRRDCNDWVYYENPLRTRVTFTPGLSLLAVEVEISKRYLAKKG